MNYIHFNKHYFDYVKQNVSKRVKHTSLLSLTNTQLIYTHDQWKCQCHLQAIYKVYKPKTKTLKLLNLLRREKKMVKLKNFLKFQNGYFGGWYTKVKIFFILPLWLFLLKKFTNLCFLVTWMMIIWYVIFLSPHFLMQNCENYDGFDDSETTTVKFISH